MIKPWVALVTCFLAAALPKLASAAEHPDFSGSWRIDLVASDSGEALMKRQGVSWLERRAARSLQVTQHIMQNGNTLTIRVESALRNNTHTLQIGGGFIHEERKRAGPIETRTAWSDDGTALVTTTRLVLKDGHPAELVIRRTLTENGRTMLQSLELVADAEPPLRARRVFRRL